MKSLSKLIMAALLVVSVSGCASTPKLPDPIVEYPTPPAALMQPARKLETISSDPQLARSSSTATPK